VDLVALHVAFISATGWETVRTSFRRFILVDPAVADVEAAIANLSLDRAGTLGWDDFTNQPVMTGPTVELDLEHRAAAERFLERVSLLDRSPCTLNAFPHFDTDAAAWLGPLQAAIDARIPLYSDDLALRRLAHSLDVSAFGTVALIEALADRDRISNEQRDKWFGDLHDARIVDVYVDAEDVVALGRSVTAAAAALGRPWTWQRSGTTQRILSFVATSRDTEARALSSYWHAAGAARMLPPAEAVEHCARAICDLIGDFQTVEIAATSTALIRRACVERDVEDPLPHAVRILHREFERRGTAEEATRLTLQLFSRLDEAGKQVVLRTLSFG
jgi:hypothetical protein